MEHRIGGLEKWDNSGNISYDPDNHHYMVTLRQKKVDVIANDIPKCKVYGKEKGDVLVLGWGGTHGAIRSSVEMLINEGENVSHLHLRHLNPLPKDLGEIIVKFQKVIIPELNMGQLSTIIRSKFLIDAIGLNKIAGKPFTKTEIYKKVKQTIEEIN